MVDALRCYALVAGAWTRAAAQYRLSLFLMILATLLITGLDFVEILIVFANTGRLAGFTVAEVAFLYGVAATCLGLADLLIGSIERLGDRIRDGSFDAMLLRPAPALALAAADQFSVRRLGKLIQSVAVLGWALSAVDVEWTPERGGLLVLMLVSGTVIFLGVFVVGAAFQFVAPGGRETMNAFTYGGGYLTQFPLGIYARHVIQLVTFVVPLGFINWYPALRILGASDPLHLPSATHYLSPAAAAFLVIVAGIAWGAGLRRYRSTGS